MIERLRATLALFVRSLRVDTRSASPYVARLGILALFLFAIISVKLNIEHVSAPGLWLYTAVTMLNFVALTLATPVFFSTAITEEKEDMTLGLLRMTSLGPLAILVGKGGGRLVAILLILLVQVPFTLLAITLGGVAFEQIMRVTTLTLTYFTMIASIGLFFSVIAPRTRHAAGLTILTLATMLLSFLAHMAVRGGALPLEQPMARAALALVGETMRAVLPFEDLITILETGQYDHDISRTVLLELSVTAAIFLASTLLFRPVNRNLDTPDQAPRSEMWVRRILSGNRDTPRRSWSQALIWKDYHYVGGGHLAVLMKLGGYGAILVISIIAASGLQGVHLQALGDLMFGFFQFLLIVELSILAGRVFAEEQRKRTLSTLALLPISLPRLCWSKILGCLLSTLPTWAFLVLGFLLSNGSLRRTWHTCVDALSQPGIYFAALVFVFFLHLVVWLSLRIKWGAVFVAIGVMIVLAFALGLLLSGVSELGLFRLRDREWLELGAILLVGIIPNLHLQCGRRLQHLIATE